MFEVTDIGGFSPRDQDILLERESYSYHSIWAISSPPFIIHWTYSQYEVKAKPGLYFPLYLIQVESFTSKGKGKRS